MVKTPKKQNLEEIVKNSVIFKIQREIDSKMQST